MKTPPGEWSLLAALACHAIPVCGRDYYRRMKQKSYEEVISDIAGECVDLAVALVAECKRRTGEDTDDK